MSSVRRILIMITLLMLSVGVSASVSAQTTEEADLSATLRQALTRLAKTGNYQYTLDATNLATYTDKKGLVIDSAAIFSSAGAVDDNNHYRDHFTLQSGTTLDDARSTASYAVDRVSIGGATYIHLPVELPSLLQVNVASGWWLDSDLLQHATDPSARLNIGTLINYPNPTQSRLSEQTISSVSDAGTKMLDQRAMHVYDFEIDGVAYLINTQPAGTFLRAIVDVLKARNLLEGNKTSGSAELWFGVDDDRLYRVHSRVDVLLPLLSLLGDSGGYDIEIKADYSITITYPDQPVTITPPASSLLNH